MKTIYFDCFSGAAGDMILGALLDAGASEEHVRAQLQALDLDGWELRTERVRRGGIAALHAVVTTREEARTRRYSDIRDLLERSALDPGTKERSLAIFERLAEAEARVHDVATEEVHFHEVGALDSIIDIVGVAAALDHFGPSQIVTSPLSLGSGTVATQHGTMPVPAPAVTELLRTAPVRAGGDGELVTPTGAAILSTVTSAYGELPDLVLEATGYGAGTRTRDIPNVVRVLIGSAVEANTKSGREVVIECNLDDMSPELLPHVIDLLLRAGASDAWITPIVMKKGRPAQQLSILAPRPHVSDLLAIVFSETTTFGVRTYEVDKTALERRWIEVEVDGMPVRVKIATFAGADTTFAPEYDDARAAASKLGIPLKEVYRLALERARGAS